jgi:hypothetical protein
MYQQQCKSGQHERACTQVQGTSALSTTRGVLVRNLTEDQEVVSPPDSIKLSEKTDCMQHLCYVFLSRAETAVAWRHTHHMLQNCASTVNSKVPSKLLQPVPSKLNLAEFY